TSDLIISAPAPQSRVAKPLLVHFAPPLCGDGLHLRQPELVAKHLRAVPGVLVVAVVLRGGAVLVIVVMHAQTFRLALIWRCQPVLQSIQKRRPKTRAIRDADFVRVTRSCHLNMCTCMVDGLCDSRK